ncbi:Diamine acetyltransferase 2 [Papilio xuthus]|uniref:Diamine acetyltransferase 2 n=1 Tax=Papilio xuthus TaxID=66420 RepID=A0A194Q0P1_PAPXU|nr:Diamine acetyltransferase 2 [Papilio xuthus]
MEDVASTSEVVIRDAEREDMLEVDKMIQELAVYEKLTDDARLNAADLVRDGFDSPAAFGCKVLEVRGEQRVVAGYALYYRTYSTCVGRGLMLEDLYVRERWRRRGFGRRLFAAVAAEAVSRGCARLELHVLSWNPARAFYEARGAVDLSDADWRYYRLDAEQLRRAALLHTF